MFNKQCKDNRGKKSVMSATVGLSSVRFIVPACCVCVRIFVPPETFPLFPCEARSQAPFLALWTEDWCLKKSVGGA